MEINNFVSSIFVAVPNNWDHLEPIYSQFKNIESSNYVTETLAGLKNASPCTVEEAAKLYNFRQLPLSPFYGLGENFDSIKEYLWVLNQLIRFSLWICNFILLYTILSGILFEEILINRILLPLAKFPLFKTPQYQFKNIFGFGIKDEERITFWFNNILWEVSDSPMRQISSEISVPFLNRRRHSRQFDKQIEKTGLIEDKIYPYNKNSMAVENLYSRGDKRRYLKSRITKIILTCVSWDILFAPLCSQVMDGNLLPLRIFAYILVFMAPNLYWMFVRKEDNMRFLILEFSTPRITLIIWILFRILPIFYLFVPELDFLYYSQNLARPYDRILSQINILKYTGFSGTLNVYAFTIFEKFKLFIATFGKLWFNFLEGSVILLIVSGIIENLFDSFVLTRFQTRINQRISITDCYRVKLSDTLIALYAQLILFSDFLPRYYWHYLTPYLLLPDKLARKMQSEINNYVSWDMKENSNNINNWVNEKIDKETFIQKLTEDFIKRNPNIDEKEAKDLMSLWPEYINKTITSQSEKNLMGLENMFPNNSIENRTKLENWAEWKKYLNELGTSDLNTKVEKELPEILSQKPEFTVELQPLSSNISHELTCASFFLMGNILHVILPLMLELKAMITCIDDLTIFLFALQYRGMRLRGPDTNRMLGALIPRLPDRLPFMTITRKMPKVTTEETETFFELLKSDDWMYRNKRKKNIEKVTSNQEETEFIFENVENNFINALENTLFNNKNSINKRKIKFLPRCQWQKYFVRYNWCYAFTLYLIDQTLWRTIIKPFIGEKPHHIFLVSTSTWTTIQQNIVNIEMGLLLYGIICSILGISARVPFFLDNACIFHVGYYMPLRIRPFFGKSYKGFPYDLTERKKTLLIGGKIPSKLDQKQKILLFLDIHREKILLLVLTISFLWYLIGLQIPDNSI